MSASDRDAGELPGLPLDPKSVRDHWVLFVIEGVLLLALGACAILIPTLASLAATIFFGWLLIVGGLVGFVSTMMGRRAPGFVWALISALLAVIAGGLLVFWPVGGVLSLTLVLAAFLMIDGALSIAYALEHRRHGSRRWTWLLVNGLLDLLLAALIVWWLPGSAAWVLGLLLGIDLIFAGTSLIAMALASRHVAA